MVVVNLAKTSSAGKADAEDTGVCHSMIQAEIPKQVKLLLGGSVPEMNEVQRDSNF